MELSKEILAVLGLDDTATEEDVKKAIAKINDDKTTAEQEKVKFKNSLDKVSSEVANLKKEKQQKMTDDEKEKERIAQLEKDNADFKAQIAMNNAKDAFIGVGYDSETAGKLAKAQLEGNHTELANIMKKHNDELIKTAKADALKEAKQVNAGKTDVNTSIYTKENFKANKISYEELVKLQAENPQLYEEITK